MAAQCARCGRALGPHESFCRNCGTAARPAGIPGWLPGSPPGSLPGTDPFARLDASLRGTTTPTRPTNIPPINPPRAGADGRLIAAIVLIFGILCAGAFFAFGPGTAFHGSASDQVVPAAGTTAIGSSSTAAPASNTFPTPNAPQHPNSAPISNGASGSAPLAMKANASSPVSGSETNVQREPAAASAALPNPPIAQPASSDPQAVIARVKASTVLILCKLPDGIASGTGFVVGPHQIGTCAHVVADAEEIYVVLSDGTHTRASVQSSDAMADAALLTCSSQLPPPLQLGRYADVREGDEIAVTGYPEFFSLTAVGMAPDASTTRGYVSAKRERETENGVVPEIQIDAAVNHGNSGGPVYRMSDGAVIALAAATMENTQGLNFATPVDAIQRLIQSGG